MLSTPVETPRKFYKQKYAPQHPKATKKGFVFEHVLVAERALGRYLPAGAEVHHVNEDIQDNRPQNLVICQDRAYHKLLHKRMRVRAKGGNPNSEAWCSGGHLAPLSSFNRRGGQRSGIQAACRECHRAYYAV